MKKIFIILILVLGFVGYFFVKPFIHAELLRGQIQEDTKTEADDVSQCRAIGYGNKACGGPAIYLVYSTKNIDESEMKGLVNKFNEVSRTFRSRMNLIMNLIIDSVGSTCDVTPQPEVILENGHCVAKPGSFVW